MTSILTNTAAMAALQTLRTIDRDMETAQKRVSSGLRVETAADNAAYWSIATTMRSDNSALSTVQDALGLGAAKVDTAYTALESAIDTVTEIKSKIVAAYGVGANREKIQEEITQLQEQLKSISESATFSGENWLQDYISDGATTASSEQPVTKQIVASFTRSANGEVAVKTVDYTLSSKTVLYDLAGGNQGILDSHASFIAENETSVSNDGTNNYAVKFYTSDQLQTVGADDNPNDRLYENSDGTYIKVAGGNWVLATTTDPGSGAKPVYNDGTDDWYYDTDAGAALEDRKMSMSVSSLNISDLDSVAAQMNALVPGSATDDADVLDMLERFVDKQLLAMTSAASSLGSIQSRIDLQENFVASLTDVIDKGVGRLVDADMNEESTRLKALQTQQQLGIQSLSIANTNAQNILQLFQQ